MQTDNATAAAPTRDQRRQRTRSLMNGLVHGSPEATVAACRRALDGLTYRKSGLMDPGDGGTWIAATDLHAITAALAWAERQLQQEVAHGPR